MTEALQKIRKSPDTQDKSGEMCFGPVKYFDFILKKIFQFLQKYNWKCLVSCKNFRDVWA